MFVTQLSIKPEPGMAVVFDHLVLHEGQPCENGRKYFMRSELLFKHSNPEEAEKMKLDVRPPVRESGEAKGQGSNKYCSIQ